MELKNKFSILFFLMIGCLYQVQAQITTANEKTFQKDDFFKSSNQNNLPNQPSPKEKIKLENADLFKKKPAKYDGNNFFSGHVRLSHKGSILTADEVIFYEEGNFAKAIGNVVLINPDGTSISADTMQYDGATQKGIANGNVILKDPQQTINTETLYYDRPTHRAYFTTGGTIFANNSTTYANAGSYNTQSKVINLDGNIKIDNDQYILEGAKILQNQQTNVATVLGPTNIINKDNPSNYVYTEDGKYNMNSKEVYLNKNSRIVYNGKTLTGNTLYFNQLTGFGTGKGDVLLRDPKERRYIKGEYGEIYEKQDSAMVTDHAYVVKMFEEDSLYFSAEKIISYQKTDSAAQKKSYLRAFKQARVFKTNVQSRADSLSFNETDGVMNLDGKPLVWSGSKQVSGDRLRLFFNPTNKNMDSIQVMGNALAISKVDSLNLKDEFHQVKGKRMSVYYDDNNQIKEAKVVGNAQAITYADDTNEKTKDVERIGITLSTCGTIGALFLDQKVEIISCNIGAEMDTYPMSLISDEQRFFPEFNWNTKDRLKKWGDIFIDSPNYEEIQYVADNPYYNAAQKLISQKEAQENQSKVKRNKKGEESKDSKE